MRKKIVIIYLFGMQFFLVSNILSMSKAEVVSAVDEAIEEAAKDLTKTKLDKAILEVTSASTKYPDEPLLRESRLEIAHLKQIFYLPSTSALATRQPQPLINALSILFTIWNQTPASDIRTLAYERIKAALDNIIKNAKDWDEEDLNDLEQKIREMRDNPAYSTTMGFVFRRALDDALNKIDESLKRFRRTSPAVPYIPAPMPTPTYTTPSFPTPSAPPAVPARPSRPALITMADLNTRLMQLQQQVQMLRALMP